jgi:hypothetical protein
MSNKLNGFVKILIVALLSAAAFWLLESHWQHALGVLPYALFLTCPLMHLFMHHGRGGHRGHDGQAERAGAGEAEMKMRP